MRNGLLAMVAMAAVGCSGVATQRAVSGEPGSPAVRIRHPCSGTSHDGRRDPRGLVPSLL